MRKRNAPITGVSEFANVDEPVARSSRTGRRSQRHARRRSEPASRDAAVAKPRRASARCRRHGIVRGRDRGRGQGREPRPAQLRARRQRRTGARSKPCRCGGTLPPTSRCAMPATRMRRDRPAAERVPRATSGRSRSTRRARTFAPDSSNAGGVRVARQRRLRRRNEAAADAFAKSGAARWRDLRQRRRCTPSRSKRSRPLLQARGASRSSWRAKPGEQRGRATAPPACRQLHLHGLATWCNAARAARSHWE